MKYICNKLCGATLTFALLIVAGCSDDITDTEEPQEQAPAGELITITAIQGAGNPQTRLGYDDTTESGKTRVTWTAGDVLYIGKGKIPEDKTIDQIYSTFTLDAGQEGKATATFTGVGADWKKGDILYAFYGNKNQMSVVEDKGKLYAMCFSYGQRQTKNNNNSHISDYDAMFATCTYNNGTVSNLSFSHLGALMKFTLTLPEEAAGKKVKQLWVETLNRTTPYNDAMILPLDGGKDVSSAPSSYFSLTLGQDDQGMDINGRTLTTYMIAMPTAETNGGELLLAVNTTDGNCYTAKLQEAAIKAGLFYTVDATLEKAFDSNSDGTSENPLQIKDADELRTFSILVSNGMLETAGKYFEMTQDIDLQNEGMVAIGDWKREFQGTFDGKGYTVKNMKVEQNPVYDTQVSLFGYIKGATIKSVNVEANIDTHSSACGGIVACSEDKTVSSYIIGCSFKGRIETDYFPGGIIGNADNTYIIGCHSTADIRTQDPGDNYQIIQGGIAADMSQSYAVGCYNTGTITVFKLYSSSFVGGIVGTAHDSSIYGCYNTGAVTWADESILTTSIPIGGFIGSCNSSGVNGCLWQKKVEGGKSPDKGIGRSSETIDPLTNNINQTAHVKTLNDAIKQWNSSTSPGPEGDTNSLRFCNFHYELGTGSNTTPVLVAGAPN